MGEITKSDFIYFQNDVLKDMKQLENKLEAKIGLLAKLITEQNTTYDQKFQLSENNLAELSKKIAATSTTEDLLTKFDNYQSKTDEKLYSQEIKISNLEKDLIDSCYKYDTIFSNNLVLPGVIGSSCIYPDTKSFFDYVNKTLKELIIAKDKRLMDTKLYKDKMTNMINQFKTLIEQNDKKFYKYIRETIENYDLKCNDRCKLLEESIEKLRVENGKYSFDLLKTTEQLNEDVKKIDNLNISIENRLQEEFKKYTKISDRLFNSFLNSQNEFDIMKEKFTELSDFIKDVRFRANIKNYNNNSPSEDDRMKFIKMSNKINFNKKINQKNIITNPNTNSVINMLTEENNSEKNKRLSVHCQSEENCETKEQESFRKTIKVEKSNSKGEESILFLSEPEKENNIDNEDKDSMINYPSIKPKIKDDEKNLINKKIKSNVKELVNCNTVKKEKTENDSKKILISENINKNNENNKNKNNNKNNTSKTQANFYKPKNGILSNKYNTNTRNYTNSISKNSNKNDNDHRIISSSLSNTNLMNTNGKNCSNYYNPKVDLISLNPNSPLFSDKLNEPIYSSSRNIFFINNNDNNIIKLKPENEQKVKKELLLNFYENNEDFEYMTEVKNKYDSENQTSRENKELKEYMSIFPVKTVPKEKYNTNKSMFIHGKLNDKIKSLNKKLCMFITDSNNKIEQIKKQLNALIEGTENKKCNLVDFEFITQREPNKLLDDITNKGLGNFRKDNSIQIGNKTKKMLKDNINFRTNNVKFMGSNDILKQIEPFLIKKFK